MDGKVQGSSGSAGSAAGKGVAGTGAARPIVSTGSTAGVCPDGSDGASAGTRRRHGVFRYRLGDRLWFSCGLWFSSDENCRRVIWV